jgi:exodeoxyribonuclease V beta subunit
MSQAADLNVFRCDLDGINLIEASAGTGKTWNICGLYLRLLLERELEVQRILVVTFTNAATAELRERIRSRIVETLDYLTGAPAGGDPFVANLIAELEGQQGRNRDDLVRRLDLALQTFDEAAIFTIHGFCQRALADNPFAAGLPMSMELVRDDSELLLQSVHDFWRRHLAGDALSPLLAGYLDEIGDSPEKYARLLKRHLAKPLATCLWPADIDRAAELDRAALDLAYASASATWLAAGESIVELLLAALPQLNANSYNETSVRQGGKDWDECFRAGEAMAPLGEKSPLYRASLLAKRTKSKCVTPLHPFFDQAEAYLTQRDVIADELARARLRLIRALLQEAGDGLRELKRARRAVSFDDMLFNVYQRLTHADYPWLAASIKARFPAALIDEFQDTDPLQYAIFHTIYRAGDTPLFLVGDPKQAIYSFRNADLHTYLQAKQQAGIEYSLTANQRSSGGLLAGLNRLFTANALAFMLPGLDYRSVECGSKPRKTFVDQSEPRADLQVWMLDAGAADAPIKKLAQHDVVAATAGEIARLINAANAGQIKLDERPLRPGDIAVLVRSHAQGSQMKRALAQLWVGSVELSQASVFQSVDAEEVERVLRAILEPSRERLLRAALATELLGCDATEIEAISHDEARLTGRLLQFSDFRETWLKRGFGVMYRRLLTAERVAERMLSRPDGERRLTNFLHLGECLHQAAEAHASPEALLRYIERQRRDGSADEAVQLRLESDQNLVQIVTIHKAKGLEYPIVFCPFLWDGFLFGGNDVAGTEYHDAAGGPVIDLRGDAIDKVESDAIKAKIKLEKSAETLRIIYVALTRAVHRCYLVAGCYATRRGKTLSISESTHSMLNWLVAGASHTPQEWFAAKLTTQQIAAAWATLAESVHIYVAALPAAYGTPIERNQADPETLAALAAPRFIPSGWRVSSYSGLSYGAVSEQAASDHDARIGSPPSPALVSDVAAANLAASLPADDILRFPRGPAAGDCIHAVFENIDFCNVTTWDAAIASALARHPQSLPGVPQTAPAESLARMLRRMLQDVMQTNLGAGLRLGSVPLIRCLTEFEFNLPARSVSAGALNETLTALGYRGPRLTFGNLAGYLKGFIDLVFEHDGRYFILDWKSNHLGFDTAAYSVNPIADAMAEHGYHLQYLLYTIALDRFLRRRIPGYQYANHFGGVLYLFVRGVRPNWCNTDGMPAGVYRHRPEESVIARLNTLLESPPHDY